MREARKIKLKETEKRWRAVKARFADYGLSVARYSPGNGHTKYRIFSSPNQHYFEYQGADYITHMVGIGHVEDWIDAFERGIQHERHCYETNRFDLPPKEEHEPNA